MSQPDWKLVYATDYSALYVDETGVYDPELMIAQEYDSGDDEAGYIVHRFPLERVKFVTKDGKKHVVPFNWEPDWPHPIQSYEPWFVSDLGKVARSVGESKDEILKQLASARPQNRAHAYESIGGYHGYDNFDGYPERWTNEEMDEKWGAGDPVKQLEMPGINETRGRARVRPIAFRCRDCGATYKRKPKTCSACRRKRARKRR